MFGVRCFASAVSGKIHLRSGVQIHGSVWHAAPHRRVRGKEKLGTIVARMAAERDEWRRRGEIMKTNGRKKGG